MSSGTTHLPHIHTAMERVHEARRVYPLVYIPSGTSVGEPRAARRGRLGLLAREVRGSNALHASRFTILASIRSSTDRVATIC